MLELILPCEKYLLSYLEFCREFKERNITNIAAIVGHDPDKFDVWRGDIFKNYENSRLGIDLPEGYVPATTFWLVEDGAMVGYGNIRHRLTPALERHGGHIGYAVKTTKWGKGYGTIQLGLLLKEAANLGIEKVLLTCYDENIASARVMEKNGGILQDTIESIIDGVPRRVRRYWIDTGSADK